MLSLGRELDRNELAQSKVPSVDGILSADEVLATALHIVSLQEPSGAVGWPDGHINAWDLVECAMAMSVCGLSSEARRAYEWLRRTQRADGSWPKRVEANTVTDASSDSNQVAYIATGMWHELLVTHDEEYVRHMWPTVRRAIEFVLELQAPHGEVLWERKEDGSEGDFALLAGSSSIYLSLLCAIQLSIYLDDPQPQWEQSARLLNHAISHHPNDFADKSRFAMDWYYPILTGVSKGTSALERLMKKWHEFVVPGLGVRCVSDQPWVTVAETSEFVMALAVVGKPSTARRIFMDIQQLRESDGSYWTGWQFANEAHFPAEHSSWSSAAIVLAADVLSRTTEGSRVFLDLTQVSLEPSASIEHFACECELKVPRNYVPQ